MSRPTRRGEYRLGRPRTGLRLAAAGTTMCLITAPLSVLTGCAVRNPGGPVAFNQFYIESVCAGGRAGIPWDDPPAATRRASPDFDDPLSIFRYVLAHAPDEAIVYPTETYYYYRLFAGARLVGGNLRLLDASSGIVHMGYFDVREPWHSTARSIGPADGVKVEAIGEHRYRVTFEGRSVVFTLTDQALARPRGLVLAEGEEWVSGIWDESGVRLHLLYNNPLHAFYYVLNEDVPLSEPMVPVDDACSGLEVGLRTGFVFYRDEYDGRRLLVVTCPHFLYQVL